MPVDTDKFMTIFVLSPISAGAMTPVETSKDSMKVPRPGMDDTPPRVLGQVGGAVVKGLVNNVATSD